MEEKLLPEEIELSEVVLSKTNHAFDLIRQEDCVAMKKRNNRRCRNSSLLGQRNEW